MTFVWNWLGFTSPKVENRASDMKKVMSLASVSSARVRPGMSDVLGTGLMNLK